MYTYAEKMIQLYNHLQDELSKKLFWARLQYEAEPNMDRAVQLYEIGSNKQISWRDQLAAAAGHGEKIILYGAGFVGIQTAERLMRSHIDIYGFCDQKRAGETILGLPVLPPRELVGHSEEYAVVITSVTFYQEISHFLRENGFPEKSVLYFGAKKDKKDQYREFPELFKRGTAIVDAGCFDGEDTISFSKWCAGAYSKIYAFEPDEKNFPICKANIAAAGVPNVSLLQTGLGESQGEGAFAGSLNGNSYLIETTSVRRNTPRLNSENTFVQIYALDDLADTEIGLIKMDIEGAEFDALQGAKKIIRRDKPLLAISVYHRQGDMLAIMEYLQSLVPEYRFWLRHYGPLDSDTLLYAAV